MSKFSWGKKAAKGIFKAGRLRERYSLGKKKNRTALKAFAAGATGSVVGDFWYDRLKEKMDKKRG